MARSCWYILVAFLFVFAPLRAQDYEAYEKKWFTQGGNSMPYRLLLPKNFNASQKYPLILVLHGSGERGNDNEKQLTHGAALFLKDSIREQFPAIVVFPQCAAESSWARIEVAGEWGNRTFTFFKKAEPTADMLLLEGLIKEIRETYAIKRNQMYVGGLSMGGMGTFELVNRNPGMFSAAFPICGGANPKIAKRLNGVDWWVFHGGADKVVPATYSTQMVEALRDKRAKVKYSLYPAVQHNSWDYAFKEPDLLPWLFTKSRLR